MTGAALCLLTNIPLQARLAPMNQLQKNPVTGFLESASPAFATFDSDKKTKFISLAQECIEKSQAPKLSAICKAIGISMASFWGHIQQDDEFKRQWDNIRFQVEDMLENSLVSLGQKANGVGAAAFWLKNKVPERWSDNPGQLQNFTDFNWVKKLGDVLISVGNQPVIATEADIISTPSKQIDNSTNETRVKK